MSETPSRFSQSINEATAYISESETESSEHDLACNTMLENSIKRVLNETSSRKDNCYIFGRDSDHLMDFEDEYQYNDDITFFNKTISSEYQNGPFSDGSSEDGSSTVRNSVTPVLPTSPVRTTETPESLPKQEKIINTYYEMTLDQSEIIRLEKRLQTVDSEEEVKKMINDPDGTQSFHDLFEVLRWKLSEEGLVSPRNRLSIGDKEEKMSISPKANDSGHVNHTNEEEDMEEEVFSESYRMTGTQNDDAKDVNLNSELNNTRQDVAPLLLFPSVGCQSSTEPEKKEDEFVMLEEETQSITKKIEQELFKLTESLVNNLPLTIRIRNRRKWSNCVMTAENTLSLKAADLTEHREINFHHQSSEKYFTLVIYLLAEIYNLLMTNSTCTKRELYYRDPDFTENQVAVDVALNDISCLLDAPLWKLGVLSSSKGLVAGDLVILMHDGTKIDASQDRGVVVPADISGIMEVESFAKYILIVEKDTVFKKLLDDNVFAKLGSNMILITGKGFPDVNTRHLVKRLIDTLGIPAYILVDADPHGIEIYFTYRFGSLALSHLEELASPSIKWIGIRPSDIGDFEIPFMRLTDEDNKKIDEMLERPYITEELRLQMMLMRKSKKKTEIESLATFSSTFLVDQYLPSMIGMGVLRKN